MSQKGRLRQTGGKGQRSAHGKMEETGSWGEQKRKKKERQKLEGRLEILVCIPCITKILVYIETNKQNKEVKVF